MNRLLVTLLAGLLALAAHSSPVNAQGGLLQPGYVSGNPTASQAPARGATLTSMFDQAFCNTIGYVIARTTGAWVCSNSIPINLSWFGGDSTGGTDSLAAARLWRDASANNQTNCLGSTPCVSGNILYAPSGWFKFSDTVTFSNTVAWTIACAGPLSTLINTTSGSNVPQFRFSGTASVTGSTVGNTLTVSAVGDGSRLAVGSVLSISGSPTITAILTGNGTVGTYTFSGSPQTISSGTITATYSGNNVIKTSNCGLQPTTSGTSAQIGISYEGAAGTSLGLVYEENNHYFGQYYGNKFVNTFGPHIVRNYYLGVKCASIFAHDTSANAALIEGNKFFTGGNGFNCPDVDIVGASALTIRGNNSTGSYNTYSFGGAIYGLTMDANYSENSTAGGPGPLVMTGSNNGLAFRNNSWGCVSPGPVSLTWANVTNLALLGEVFNGCQVTWGTGVSQVKFLSPPVLINSGSIASPAMPFASLPTCGAARSGDIFMVNDATVASSVMGAAIVGGGSILVQALCSFSAPGSTYAWISNSANAPILNASVSGTPNNYLVFQSGQTTATGAPHTSLNDATLTLGLSSAASQGDIFLVGSTSGNMQLTTPAVAGSGVVQFFGAGGTSTLSFPNSTATYTFPSSGGTIALTGSSVASFSAGTTGLTPNSATTGAVTLAGTLIVANGGTNCAVASVTCFNNITGFSAAGTTGTTSTNLAFSASPTFTGTVILPSVTLGGTLSGGGNQLNNVIIGTSTPLAGSFTTVNASTSYTGPGTGLTGTAASLTAGLATNLVATSFATFSPTVTAQAPGITPPTFTVNSARFLLIGKICYVQFDVTVSAQNTGSGRLLSTLPGSCATNTRGSYSVAGSENATTFSGLTGIIPTAGNQIQVALYNNVTPIITGYELVFSAWFEIN